MKDKGGGRKASRTKTGCWTCRERKVRCDETKPICSHCTRLGLTCAGYGARITFRDDTSRVLQRMESVTDTQGCAVYEESTEGPQSSPQPRLRYKTYTPIYFENHKDIEIETDLLDLSPSLENSELLSKQISPTANKAPHSFVRNPASQHYSDNISDSPYTLIPHGEYASTQLPSYLQAQSWPMPASSQRSPISPEAQGFQFSSVQDQSRGRHDLSPYSNSPFGSYQPFVQNRASQMNNDTSRIDNNQVSQYETGPQIVIGESPSLSNTSVSQLNAQNQQQHVFARNMAIPSESNMHLLVPQNLSHRSRRLTGNSDTDSRIGPSPSSLKWAEHFGGRNPSSTSSVADLTDSELITSPVESGMVPSELLRYTTTLVPYHVGEDEECLRHYFSFLVRQICYPDRGTNNPFRLLLTTLCPSEPALFHAILAFAATDLAHNAPTYDQIGRFSRAAKHYDAAVAILTAQLQDMRHEQSIAALATAYFLDLCDTKNCRPIRHTGIVLQVVKARSAAGRIYEGGICWTWYNATLGVLSALFGGPVLVMPYLIETDQLPTPGQGNMFPFIKKTEQERIEHTIISPMYISQQRFWAIFSNLSILANSSLSKTSPAFRESLETLRLNIELSWSSRAKLIDDLTGDSVEDAFLTKWTTGIPIAEQIVMTYNAAHLYAELLYRGIYALEELQTRVSVIFRIFEKIRAVGEVFCRRFVLVPIFLCSLLCPDIAQRQHIINTLAQVVGREASWNKALEVATDLLETELKLHKTVSDASRRQGTTQWHDVRDRLGGIALF